MSVCHIEYPETMDEQRHRPREKGLNDPKLGSIDRGTKCATCGEVPDNCPGHFGHIELAVPVFHVGMSPSSSLISHTTGLTRFCRFHHEDQEDSRVSLPQLWQTQGRRGKQSHRMTR